MGTVYFMTRAIWLFVVILSLTFGKGNGERPIKLKKQHQHSSNTNKTLPIVHKESPCFSRGANCSYCLSDGNCGFCDTCKDVCHKPGAAANNSKCSHCAKCIPGTLAGPSKANECRLEWFYYEKCPEVVNEQKTVYVEIALYLVNIHSVDLKSGTFHADFYLYFKVPDGQTKYTKQRCKDGPKGACFELVNAAGQPEVSSHEGKYFRVKSTFNFAADLKDYPFDNQTLQIVIQDMEMAAKELRWKFLQRDSDLTQDFKFRSGVSPILNYTGWLFDTNSWSQMVYERYNPFLDQGVSRYEFFFHMKRHKRASFFKIFLPPLFIVLVVCFSFSIPPKDSSMRLWIDGSLLISAVMFHATTGEQTPDSQELTLADSFMVGVYGFIFASFIVTITMLRLQRENYLYFAATFYSHTEWLVWFTGPTFFFLLYYMRFSLYHVVLSEIIVSLCALSLKFCFSYSKKKVFKFTSMDKILEKHRSATTPEQYNVFNTGLVDRPDRSHDGYQKVSQNEDILSRTSTNCQRSCSRTCFPGKTEESEDLCPKRKTSPFKET